jgi:alkanesulfonate monooxygenase SsuD/methylene tetrahydromethanopterin reductase-like flavin-dependent oxidoreductase (luciferase family)
VIEIGIDSFAANVPNPLTGAALSPVERIAELLAEIETADRVGIDVFDVGEHYRAVFLVSASTVILAATATRTERMRLTSAVTVLNAADPVRVFQEFATLDLLAMGRAEIVVGRGSFAEAFPLFGFSMNDYDALFVEKLDLLLKLRDEVYVDWQGRFRAPLTGQGVFPRPHQDKIPIWLGVGGTPQSFARAGTLGLPLMIGIIGGGFEKFRPLVELYREAGRAVGHAPDTLRVGVHAMGFVGDTVEAAKEAVFPGWSHQQFSLVTWLPAGRYSRQPIGATEAGGYRGRSDERRRTDVEEGSTRRSKRWQMEREEGRRLESHKHPRDAR